MTVAVPRNDARRPNIYDIAALAGVSHMTVSRVMNDEPGMTPETRARVRALIDRVAYEPNPAARALAGRTAQGVGVIAVSSALARVAGLTSALQTSARRHGHRLVSLHSEVHDAGSLFSAVAPFATPDARVICVVRLAGEGEALDALAGVRAVAIADHRVGELRTVGASRQRTIELALEHLAALGHRSVVLVAEGKAEHAGICRGLPLPRQIPGDGTADSGFRIGRDPTLLGAATAVLASNPSVAMGLVHGLRDRGRRVPDDVSVLSLEDSADAAHGIPPLTAVTQPVDEIAALAIAHAVAKKASAGPSPGAVEPCLCVRSSTSASRWTTGDSANISSPDLLSDVPVTANMQGTVEEAGGPSALGGSRFIDQ